MYELTAGQTQEVGGGSPKVPYHHESQRIVLPPWPQDQDRLDPPNYEPPNRTLPQF